VTVQLDRPEDLVLGAHGIAPEPGERHPLTRRERRARERAAAEQYRARQLPVIEPAPDPAADRPSNPAHRSATAFTSSTACPSTTACPPGAAGASATLYPSTTPYPSAPDLEPAVPGHASSPSHRARAEQLSTVQLPLEPPPGPRAPVAPSLRVEAPRAPSCSHWRAPGADADAEELPLPAFPASPMLPAFPVATYHPRHHADPYAVGACPAPADEDHRAAEGPESCVPAACDAPAVVLHDLALDPDPAVDDVWSTHDDWSTAGQDHPADGSFLTDEPYAADDFDEACAELPFDEQPYDEGPYGRPYDDPCAEQSCDDPYDTQPDDDGPAADCEDGADPYRRDELPLTVELDARTVSLPQTEVRPDDSTVGDQLTGTEHPHDTEHLDDTGRPGPYGGDGRPGHPTEPAAQALPRRRSLYRPLVTMTGARPVPVVRPPVPAPPPPSASTPARSTTPTLYRPTDQAPNRLLPPGRPGAPGLTASGEPAPRATGAARQSRPGRRSRARRAVLAAFAVVGIVAGVFGGLQAGNEIARARTDQHLTEGAAVGSGSTPGSGADAVVTLPELDRAATATPAPAADRGAEGMPRIGGSSPGAATGDAQHGAPAGRTDLYVYWVTSSATRSLLAREYRAVPDYGDPLVSAVQAVLRLQPTDRDYGSPWRPADSVSVISTGTGITVTVSADAFSAPGIGSAVAAAGIQQLVWTVTAAAQREVPVTIQVPGSAGFQAWGAVTLGTPTSRDARFRASVWIDTPQEGSVQHGTLRIAGQGSAFEGTYRWQVTKAGKQVAAGVASGTPAGPGTGWTQFAVDVALPVGAYQLTVAAEDPGDQEMPAGWVWPDTRNFNVA
jgi:hypothetical protein